MYLNRIEKLFTDVISHNIVEESSKLYVELKTTEEWNEKAAMAFQTLILDRNPFAFGGPYDFSCNKQENFFIVKWNCYNIAD